MTVVVLVLVALVLVIGLGYLIVFRLMKGSQTIVPDVSDEHSAKTDRVVAVDDQGQPVTESQDTPPEPQRDATGFEKVLGESLDDLHPGREE
jgi:predicted PurR-regulated permease PerM